MFSEGPLLPHVPENYHLGRCPHCDGLVAARSNIFLGELGCPNCRQSLWFLQSGDLIKFFADGQTLELKERVLQFWEQKLELPRDELVNCPDLLRLEGIESLSMVEMVMEFEEDFGDDLTFGEDDQTL